MVGAGSVATGINNTVAAARKLFYDARLSGNEHFSRLLRKLRETYEIILVDTGSLVNSNGTFWLMHSDFNILVIDSTRTTRESLEYQKLELENSNLSIHGSILNKRKNIRWMI